MQLIEKIKNEPLTMIDHLGYVYQKLITHW